ncbi:hypothetical protein F7725_021263 [Dissostichus mawsoni]|uniref:AIG1-type G domain-containing protein n=1 Tax=Dissostichus mawsoni TaxID=36200 RepID=A0A7J5YFN0_DISMA|nr:hypothetical protein F7725_021263 [Dissostichus mawsoni]
MIFSAGKSTLINALVNYALGVKYEDNVWYQIVEEEKKSQAESQTSDVIVYEVFGHEEKTLPFSLTIIDTPGFGDTRGIERDVLVSERLLDLFRSTDGVHEIDAVCLVLKASDNRLNDRLMYVFDSVVSLFGKDIEENIVALITHSDFVTTENVLQALKDASDFLKNTKPQNLKETVEVLNSRIRLTACIHNLQERVEFIELKQKDIQQTQEALKKHEQDMKNNDKYEIEVNETFKIKVPIDERRWWMLRLNNGGATSCTVCKETCHYPCTVARIQTGGDRPEGCFTLHSVHLDFLIEKMKEKGDTEKFVKLEEMKRKMDENPRIKSALSYLSGAGKSTLINALVNYALGVKYEDNVWYQIVEERRRVKQKVRHRVHEIDAVCLVLKASDNRLMTD